MEETVHISGCGVLSPIGLTIEDHIEYLKNGDELKLMPGEYQELTGKIPDFRPRDYIKDRKALKVMSRSILLGCISAKQALESSGFLIDHNETDSDGNGVIWGSSITNSMTCMKDIITDSANEDGTLNYEKLGDTGYRQVPPLWIIPKLPNTAAGQISIQNQFKGINYSIVNGVNNGFISVGEAFESIKYSESERILCGASEENPHSDFFHMLYSLDVASVTNNGSLSFSGDSDGAIISEAGVSFHLEAESSLEKRGGKSFGRITGYGNTYVPDFKEISEKELSNRYIDVMKSTLDDAGLKVSDIDFIQATGCGISKIDKAEALAIKKLFGKKVYVTSVASTAGYVLTASGPLSILTAMIQLKNGFISSIKRSKNLFLQDDINYVQNTIEFKSKRALCNSFDYFGSACSMVLES